MTTGNEPDTAPAKRRFMSDGEIYKAMGLLTTHLKRAGTGFAYANGWSDEAVAAEVGCSLNNISGLRERNFGKLGKMPETDPRVDELQAVVFDLVLKHNGLVRELLPTTGVGDPYLVLTGEQS